MTTSRPHPFDLLFAELAPNHFPLIQAAIGNTPDLDPFLMAEPVITLLREMRPEEGLGESGEDFIAFVHAAYRYWAAGAVTRELSSDETHALCDADMGQASESRTARYIHVAPRIIWGNLDGADHFEPLDGWFVVPVSNGLRAVGLFGVHAGRPGLSVLQVEGEINAAEITRDNGTALFAPTMTGGDVAGLHAIVSLGELLLLAWRAEGMKEGADG